MGNGNRGDPLDRLAEIWESGEQSRQEFDRAVEEKGVHQALFEFARAVVRKFDRYIWAEDVPSEAIAKIWMIFPVRSTTGESNFRAYFAKTVHNLCMSNLRSPRGRDTHDHALEYLPAPCPPPLRGPVRRALLWTQDDANLQHLQESRKALVQRVPQLIADGLSKRAIAEVLGISESTVGRILREDVKALVQDRWNDDSIVQEDLKEAGGCSLDRSILLWLARLGVP